MWEYNHTPSPDELYHYGVVGMKWGKRRAAARGQSYTYTSHSTKKYNKKVAKLSKKKKLSKVQQEDLTNYKNRAKRSAQHDKNMQRLADKTSTGVAVGSGLLVGPGNVKGYMQSRAAGKSVARAGAGTLLGGQLAGMYDKSQYIRQDELKKKKR